MLIDGIITGILGYMFVYKLIQAGEIFSFYGRFLQFLDRFSTKTDIFSRFITYLIKPLGGCIVCFSGQLALWIGVLHFGLDTEELIKYITLSLFTAHLLETKLY